MRRVILAVTGTIAGLVGAAVVQDRTCRRAR